jgi:translation initiation factor 3 subunit G
VTEYRRNPVTGAKEKVIRKYKRETRVIQVPKAVEERAAWRRFGKAKEGNEGTTARSVEEISIEKPGQEAKSELAMLAETQRSIFTCRKCGGPHSSLKCPYKDVTLGGGVGGPAPHAGPGAMQGADGGAGSGAGGGGDGEGGGSGGGGKYVPPSKKRLEAAAATGAPVPTEDLTTLRVTNLSEDAEEDDLRALFSRYGRLERVRARSGPQLWRGVPFASLSFASLPSLCHTPILLTCPPPPPPLAGARGEGPRDSPQPRLRLRDVRVARRGRQGARRCQRVRGLL